MATLTSRRSNVYGCFATHESAPIVIPEGHEVQDFVYQQTDIHPVHDKIDALVSGAVLPAAPTSEDTEADIQDYAAVGLNCSVGLTPGMDKIDRLVATHAVEFAHTALSAAEKEQEATEETTVEQTKPAEGSESPSE